MSQVQVHQLKGCHPTPLSSYLKALAILRLVGEQADPAARGFWRDNGFHLATRLDSTELEEFFATAYQPTPLVAPWNGGSGFYPKDNKSGFDAIVASNAQRFDNYRGAIEKARSVVGESLDAPKKQPKYDMQRSLLAMATGSLAQWLRAVIVIKSDGEPAYPALLGTGGNDGRLDFTNQFMQRLAAVFDFNEVEAPMRPSQRSALSAALWRSTAQGSDASTMGQFNPGSVSGANFGNGFDGKSVTNPWDYILGIEGAVSFAASATRRLENGRPGGAAAPFSASSLSGGYGSASPSDESARGEQWFPIWPQAATAAEVGDLLREGRASVGRSGARGAMDFARSVARLGVSRGISAFVRYGYIERNGQANLATPLGTWTVAARGHQRLIDQIEPWAYRLRRAAGGDHSPASIQRASRALQSAILACCGDAQRRDWQHLLFAMGQAEAQLVRSPKFAAEKGLQPIPDLTAGWLDAVGLDDRAIRLALSLSLLKMRGNDKESSIRGFLMPLSKQRSRSGATFEVVGENLAFSPDVIEQSSDGLRALSSILRRLSVRRSAGVDLGLMPLAQGCSLKDLSAFLEGSASPDRILDYLRPLLAIRASDSGEAAKRLKIWHDTEDKPNERPTLPPLFSTIRAVVPHCVPPNASGPARLEQRVLALLRAGQANRALQTANQRLRARGWTPLLRTGAAAASACRLMEAAILFPLTEAQIFELTAQGADPPTRETR